MTEQRIISFLRRYWWVIALVIGAYLLARWDAAFRVLDVMAYLPLLFAAWVAFPLAWRNIFNRDTTDKYIDNKGPKEDFWAMSPKDRMFYTLGQFAAYLIGSAIVVHALATHVLFSQ